jgi:hypothetical protein
MAWVNVQTGAVTGEIVDGESFDWKAPNYTGSVYVTAQLMNNGEPWFSPSGINTEFTAPDGSFTVTAEGVSVGTGWSYTANIPTQGVRIQVESSFPHKGEKKAS